MRTAIPVIILVFMLPVKIIAQTDSASNTVPDKAARYITERYQNLNSAITRQAINLLGRMQHQEEKLQKKLEGIDSSRAADVFANSQSKYKSLLQKLQTPVNPNTTSPLREYLPGFDSMQTAVKFLGQYGNSLRQLQGVAAQMQQLQGTLQQTNEIQAFLKDREQQLQNQLGQYHLGGNLLGMNKQLYYYQQQLKQYKALANDPQKLGKVLLDKAAQMPAFQEFFKRNSYLAQLFGTPDNYGSPASVAGLQTRTMVQQLVSQFSVTGSQGGVSGQSVLQQQVQGAQEQLTQLQSNVAKTGGGNSDAVMPDFKPNTEKTKPFFKRLELGFNLQNTQATHLAPSMSTLAVTLGYKLSPKATAGVGVSYILGVGRPVNYIKFTNEGAGLRLFIDVKAKGSFWLSGGMESDYFQTFSKLSDLNKNITAWQKKALLGVTKKYKISNNKQGNIQLLYDFLYNQHIPVSQPLIFRMGYSF